MIDSTEGEKVFCGSSFDVVDILIPIVWDSFRDVLAAELISLILIVFHWTFEDTEVPIIKHHLFVLNPSLPSLFRRRINGHGIYCGNVVVDELFMSIYSKTQLGASAASKKKVDVFLLVVGLRKN